MHVHHINLKKGDKCANDGFTLTAPSLAEGGKSLCSHWRSEFNTHAGFCTITAPQLPHHTYCKCGSENWKNPGAHKPIMDF